MQTEVGKGSRLSLGGYGQCGAQNTLQELILGEKSNRWQKIFLGEKVELGLK